MSVKVIGRMEPDGSGVIKRVGSSTWTKVPGAGSTGEMLIRMRTHAFMLANCPEDEFEFEMIEEDDERGDDGGQVDPKLCAPDQLQARRASGEHLCFFCTHDPVCAIAASTRQHAQALIVIGGCAQFSMIKNSRG